MIIREILEPGGPVIRYICTWNKVWGLHELIIVRELVYNAGVGSVIVIVKVSQFRENVKNAVIVKYDF